MKKRLLVIVAVSGILAIGVFVAAPHLLPTILSCYRPDIRFSVAPKENRLVITIDDAPSRNTAEILRVLKKHEVPATFFVIADRVKSSAQLEEIVRAGQSLGNHLKTTRACSKLSLAEFKSDFDACAALLGRVAKPEFFRPASDFGTIDQIAYARSKGCDAVMGTVFPMDHWISDTGWLVRISRWLAVRGGIVILHDGDVRGKTTAEVLDHLIPELKSAGYVFGRLDKSDRRSSGH